MLAYTDRRARLERTSPAHMSREGRWGRAIVMSAKPPAKKSLIAQALDFRTRHDTADRHRRGSALVLMLVGTAVTAAATLALTTLLAPPPASAHRLASRHGLQSLPVGLAATASASIGASERSFWPVRHGGSLLAKGGGIQSTFTASEVVLRVAQGTLDLSLAAVGHGQRLQPVSAASPSGAGSQVLYRQGSVSGFYSSGPYGLEQGLPLPN